MRIASPFRTFVCCPHPHSIIFLRITSPFRTFNSCPSPPHRLPNDLCIDRNKRQSHCKSRHQRLHPSAAVNPPVTQLNPRPAAPSPPSERLSLSGSEGKRLYETQNINLSLSSLGDVLACLSKNATIMSRRNSRSNSGGHAGGNGDAGGGGGENVAPVPYRNSKLTHFLKVGALALPVVASGCLP